MARARATAVPMTRRCPTCTPSNVPSASTTGPPRSGGTSARSRAMCNRASRGGAREHLERTEHTLLHAREREQGAAPAPEAHRAAFGYAGVAELPQGDRVAVEHVRDTPIRQIDRRQVRHRAVH